MFLSCFWSVLGVFLSVFWNVFLDVFGAVLDVFGHFVRWLNTTPTL